VAVEGNRLKLRHVAQMKSVQTVKVCSRTDQLKNEGMQNWFAIFTSYHKNGGILRKIENSFVKDETE
jgi:hypothetical protein